MQSTDMVRVYLLSVIILGVMYYSCNSEYALYLLKPKFGEPCSVDYWSPGEVGLCVSDNSANPEKKYISSVNLITKSYFRDMFENSKTVPIIIRVPVMAEFDGATFTRAIFTGRARRIYFPGVNSMYEHVITNHPFDYSVYRTCDKLIYCSQVTWACTSDSGSDNTCVIE